VVVGVVVDGYDLQVLRALAGAGMTVGLLLFGPASSKGVLIVAGLLLCVAQNLSVALAVKVTYIVPARQAHIVTIGINCCFDASSAVPQIPLIIHQAGVSRLAIFGAYAALCAVLSALHILLWLGRPTERLRAVAREEGSDEPKKKPLHGKRLVERLRSVEFAFAVAWLTTQIFRSQFYLAMIVDLLRMQGDTGAYADTFAAFHPVSMLFAPLLSWCLLPRGFVFSFAATLALGLVWNAVAFAPSLPVQILSFTSYSIFRAFTFSLYFVFITQTFGASSTASIHSIAMAAGSFSNFRTWPSVAFVNEFLGADLKYMLGLCLILNLPLLLPFPLLRQRLLRNPAAEHANARGKSCMEDAGTCKAASAPCGAQGEAGAGQCAAPQKICAVVPASAA